MSISNHFLNAPICMTFFVFLLAVAVVWYMRDLSARISALERRLAGGEPRLIPAASVRNGGAPAPAAITSPQPAVEATRPAAGLHAPVSSISLAQWVGGVGILALLFGFAFFFKFAIDQGWVTEWARIGTGVLVGVLFIVLGELWRTRFAKYAEVLSAGGLGVLYFTVHAAYSFYHKVDPSVGLLCLIVITITALTLAARHSSKVLGLLGLAGAYVSPFLVDFAFNDHVAFFGYVTLVNVGLVGLLWFGFWSELLFAGFVGTVFNFIWHGFGIRTGDTVMVASAFIMANYVLVCAAVPLLYRKGRAVAPAKTGSYLGVFYVVSGVGVLLGLMLVLTGQYQTYLAPLLLLAGVATYFGYALLDRLEEQVLNYALVAMGTVLTVAACMWQFSGFVEHWYVLVLAAALFAVGVGMRRKELWFFGVVATLFAAVRVVAAEAVTLPYEPLLNARFLTEMAAAAALCAYAFVLRTADGDASEQQFPGVLVSVAGVLIWFAGSQEIVGTFAGVDMINTRNLLLSLWWMVHASVMMLVGALPAIRIIRRVATALFVLTVLKVFLYDVQALDLGFRVVSFMVLGIILLIVAFYYQKHKDAVGKFLAGDIVAKNK